MLTLLNVADRRLNQINTKWDPPLEGGVPMTRDLLSNILAHCEDIQTIATGLLASLPREEG